MSMQSHPTGLTESAMTAVPVGGYDPITDEFETYEAYLLSQVSKKDLYYLEDMEIACQLVELGIRGNGETIPREEFQQRQANAEKLRQVMLNKKAQRLVSEGMDCEDAPLLKALQLREEAVRNGKLATIIFIRDFNSKGQEISGHIDYSHRLQSESMEKIFQRQARLLPTASDLSFYNWNAQTATINSTAEFQVVADDEKGMLFKNKRDRKLIQVDPETSAGDNSTRTVIQTTEYVHVVLYDHVTRRRD